MTVALWNTITHLPLLAATLILFSAAKRESAMHFIAYPLILNLKKKRVQLKRVGFVIYSALVTMLYVDILECR